MYVHYMCRVMLFLLYVFCCDYKAGLYNICMQSQFHTRHTCTHACIHPHTHTHHLHTRMHTHPHPLTHTHTCTQSPPPPTHTQENNLKDSLHIDASDLKSSAEVIQSRIMSASLPAKLRDEIASRLKESPFSDSFVAVRSSGTDEDSSAHSFAGIALQSASSGQPVKYFVPI